MRSCFLPCRRCFLATISVSARAFLPPAIVPPPTVTVVPPDVEAPATGVVDVPEVPPLDGGTGAAATGTLPQRASSSRTSLNVSSRGGMVLPSSELSQISWSPPLARELENTRFLPSGDHEAARPAPRGGVRLVTPPPFGETV